MAVSRDGEEERAIAIAVMSFTYALAGVVKRAGVLDPEATEGAFEAALSSVERAYRASDQSAALARQLLEHMSGQLAEHVPSPGSARRRLVGG